MIKLMNIGIAIIISTFIAANAILLFSDKSELTRTYYVNDYDRVAENTYTKELEKESVIVPSNVTTVTVDVDAVSEWMVKAGDIVLQGSELAQLNTESADKQRAIWESEQQAYMSEQTQIQSMISSLESERTYASSNASSNGTTTGETEDEVIDVNVDVDVEIIGQGDYAHAISGAEQKLLEVERNLQIISTQLELETNELALLSATDGIVEAIEEKDGKYFIHLYTQEKSILTYAKESEWHKIEEGQKVKNYSTHKEGVLEGSIQGKMQMPAAESDWLKAYEQFDKKTEEPVYEVNIQLTDQLDGLPFGANINSVIITNEAQNAVRVKAKWLLDRADEKAEVYTLSAEGQIVRTPVIVPFDLKQYAILSAGLEANQIVLNADTKYINSPAFLPLPMDLPSWNSFKAVGWKNYVKYLTYK